MTSELIVNIPPEQILTDSNAVRFGLKPFRVARLAEQIKEAGQVLTPVEVSALAEAVGKAKYRMTTGHYRHAAVLALNKEGAGLTLPAIVRPVEESVERIKRQLQENAERENLSPMDEATAIKGLLDAGVQKMEVRRIFSRPGGRKGLAMQPASNSYINMTLSFLDLPKSVQEKIHDGRVGVAAAYELTKVAPDKRAEVLERAEAERQAEIDRDEKAEERLLSSEKKVQDAVSKAEEAKTAKEKAEDAVAAAKDAVNAVGVKAAAAYKVWKATVEDKAKKEAEKAFRALEKEGKDAEKAQEKAKAELDKLSDKAKTAVQLAKEKAEKLAEARKPKVKAKVTASGIKKSAAAAESKYVPLTLPEIRQTIKDMQAASVPTSVQAIAGAFERCFKGEITTRQLIKQLSPSA